MTTPHPDPADYVGPHDDDQQHAAQTAALHAEAPATPPDEYTGPHGEEHHDAPHEDHTLHEKAEDMVHHLEDAMHELEERRRMLTGEETRPG